ALSQQNQSLSHRTRTHRTTVFQPVREVQGSKALGHQSLDASTDDVIVRITEQGRHLAIGEANDPGIIDDDHCIGRGIERAAGQFRRGRQHLASYAWYGVASALLAYAWQLSHGVWAQTRLAPVIGARYGVRSYALMRIPAGGAEPAQIFTPRV